MLEDEVPEEDREPEVEDRPAAGRDLVPEADALEQDRELEDTAAEDAVPSEIDPEVPEADAIEQARRVGGTEDDDRR